MQIQVNQDKLTLIQEEQEVINSGAIDYYRVDITFDNSWDSLTKKVILIPNNKQEGEEIAVIDNKISIDVKHFGTHYIGIVGYTIIDNIKTIQISTNLESIYINEGAGGIECDEHEIPDSSEWEIYIAQIQAMINNVHSIPEGGTTGQFLKKKSNDDFDIEWATGGGGGTTNHAELDNLDFENSGHTGFASESEVRENTLNILDLERNKVNKEDGKGLSTNDYSTEEKNKLAGLSNYDDTDVVHDITCLEEVNNELKTYEKQVNFINFIKNKKNYKKSLYWNNPSYGLCLGFVDYDNNIIVYSFKKETEDDYIKWLNADLNNGNSTSIVPSIYSNQTIQMKSTNFDELVSNVVWGGTATNKYTTQIGATLSGTFWGSSFKFLTYLENRGGLVRFIIDNGEPIDISLYSEQALGQKLLTVAVGLDPTIEHTVEATFLGQDPEHPVTTPRFWARNDDTGLLATFYGDCEGSSNKSIFLDWSNKLFAFSCTYNGISSFIPAHSDIGSVIKIDNPIYKIDGSVIDITNIDGVAEFNTFELVQHFYGNINSTNIMEIWINQEIVNGINKVSGRFLALKEFLLGSGYVGMLPLHADNLQKCLSGFENIKTNLRDSSLAIYDKEGDSCHSYAGIDSENKNIIASYNILDIENVNRRNTGKAYSYLTNRNDTFKLYNQVFVNDTIPINYEYCFKFEIGCANIANIYEVLKNISDINNKEDISNKVTSISSSSTDTQYPSAKCVYDIVGNIETLLGGI